MICPICRQDVTLRRGAIFPIHRISDDFRHRYSFCDMSGVAFNPETMEVRA